MKNDGIAEGEPSEKDELERVRALVRRVIERGGRDPDAVEELIWYAKGDPFNYTSSPGEVDARLLDVAIELELKALLEQLLDDGVVTVTEDDRLRGALSALSGGQPDAVLAAFEAELIVARARGGSLDSIPTRIVLKPDEVTLHDVGAGLVGEIAQSKWVAGTAGVSVPLGGLRFRLGGTQGRTVETDRSWEVVDEGRLTVTTLRTVYAGMRKTIEIPHARLVGVTESVDNVSLQWRGSAAPAIWRVAKARLISHLIATAARP